jgi:hypothetical protein
MHWSAPGSYEDTLSNIPYWSNIFEVDDWVKYIPDHGSPTPWQDLGFRTSPYGGPRVATVGIDTTPACSY